MRSAKTLLAGGLLLTALTSASALGDGINGTAGYTLLDVYDADSLSGLDLLPSVHVVNTPLVNLDGTTRPAKGHFVTAVDSTMFSIYPPMEGCGYGLATTSSEARYRGCSVAMNAGFFEIKNETHPHCRGGVVSDNVLIDNDETGQVHFGLTSHGQWFVGYVEDDFLADHTLKPLPDRCNIGGECPSDADMPWYFRSLAAGRFHLVNSARNYVNESLGDGSASFTTEVSGRTAIGVLGDGRLGMLQIDGKTGQDGLDLFTLADLMIELGFVQAVNLDGGGSSATAINGVLASLPSDRCPDDDTGYLGCERPVSTIACLHSSAQGFLAG